jgi:hypothetical protein
MEEEEEEVEVVEHVVLFRAEESPTRRRREAEMEEWASGLRALRSLEGVVELEVGTVRTASYGGAGGWTHGLYGRYKDKESLAAYAAHPDHVRAVARGAPLFSAVMALDWAARVKPAGLPDRPAGAKPAAAVPRWIAFFRWAPGTPPDTIPRLVLSALRRPPPPGGFTLGPNFSPARARGFQWGLATFHDGDGDGDTDGDAPPLVVNELRSADEVLLLRFSPMLRSADAAARASM